VSQLGYLLVVTISALAHPYRNASFNGFAREWRVEYTGTSVRAPSDLGELGDRTRLWKPAASFSGRWPLGDSEMAQDESRGMAARVGVV
jgi:hypothetical protein